LWPSSVTRLRSCGRIMRTLIRRER
jgi:hypothetical protein